jgi:hypothetical protein
LFGGEIVKKTSFILLIFCLIIPAFAGYKVKNIKNKKPEQFQSRITMDGVTYAADLLLKEKDQEKYFCTALTTSDLIAVRLAVFNNGGEEVVLPLAGIRLIAPEGNEFPIVEPERVARAVLGKEPVTETAEANSPAVQVGAGGARDPRTDPSDPRYDPRLDPNSPRYDPNDPRNRGQYPPTSYPTGSYPPGTIPSTYPGTYPPGSNPSGGPWGNPGIILNPGGRGADLSKYEQELAEKDFSDKAHTSEPILRSMSRDRFLYFSIPSNLTATKGYILRLPKSRGIPQEVVLKF